MLRPLVKGCRTVIAADPQFSDVSPEVLHFTLGRYTRSQRYLTAMTKTSARRVNLDGSDGEVVSAGAAAGTDNLGE
jgi:sRNA-binding protein